MSTIIDVPADLLNALGDLALDDGRLNQWTVEAMAAEAYREGLISRGKLAELLGLSYHACEEWLRAHNILLQYTVDDLEADRETFQTLFTS